MNKKMYVLMALAVLAVGFVAAKVYTTQDATLKAKIGSSGLVIDGNYYDSSSASKTGIITGYCSHEETVFEIGTTNYNLARSTQGMKDTFEIRSTGKIDCVKGDLAWITVRNFSSVTTEITKKGKHRKIIEVVEPQYLIDYKTCVSNADTWYAEHLTERWSWVKYQVKLGMCELEKDKAECELNPLNEWRWGKCFTPKIMPN